MTDATEGWPIGAGYAFCSMSLEILDESPTQGEIEKALPWIKNQKNYLGPTTTKELAKKLPQESLTGAHFIGS